MLWQFDLVSAVACDPVMHVTLPSLHHMQLLDWSNYVLNSERSWPALGLEADPNKPQQAAGVYTYEGHPMTLLREAIRTWTRHHAFRAFHIRAATNGYHVAPADQVACCSACWMRRLCLKVYAPASYAKTTVCGLLTAVHPSLSCLKTTLIQTHDA